MLFREEEKALFRKSASGISSVDDEQIRKNRHEAAAWNRCLSNVKDHFLFFLPDVVSGETPAIHPLYDILLKRLGKGSKDLEVRNTQLVKGGVWSLAGRTVKLEREDVFRPKFSDVYKIEPNTELTPKTMSPTQLECLLSCPFQWYHKYYLGLAASEPAKSETTRTREGNMAHKMVEELEKTFEKFMESGFEDYYKEQLQTWIETHLPELFTLFVRQVFFGLTDDGHFCAYIPESWSDIQFDTGAVYGRSDYGRLILKFEPDPNAHGVIDNTYSNYTLNAKQQTMQQLIADLESTTRRSDATYNAMFSNLDVEVNNGNF
jgi:hypothetical protein